MARTIIIAGVDRTDDVLLDGFRIEAVLTYQRDTANFKIKGEAPTEGQEVIISDGSTRLFAGIIDQVKLVSADLPRVKEYSISASDYGYMLDRRLVVETYTNMAADAIFLDIVSKYCPGFTTTGVQSGAPVIEKIVFDYTPVTDAFKQLCDYIGWSWQVDYFKDLHFFNPSDEASPAPMTLEAGANFRNLRHDIDTQGLRNRVYVRGGTMLSDPWTYEVKADGTARAWVLPHKPHDLSMTVGGNPVTVGIEYVHDEADYDYMMNFQEKYVRCSTQTTTPAAGTTMAFTYKYDIDVITMVEDIASQQAIAAVQGGDGVYEHVIVDDSLTTIDAAEAAGNADLREHANPRVRGSFETETEGWQTGQLLTIDLPDRGITGTFLVQKVSIVPLTDTAWTYKIEYGGRLLGIADYLQALWKAQQKKKLNETTILHKFTYGQETVQIADKMHTIPQKLPYYVREGPAFNRDSVAYKQNGTRVAVDEPRFESGKFGQAVMVEEGTTNLLTENQSSVETDLEGLAGWSSYGSHTFERDTTTAWHGLSSAKVTSTYDGSQNIGVLIASGSKIPVDPNTPYSFNVYVKASAAPGRMAHVTVFFYDSEGIYTDVAIASGSVEASPTWARLIASGTSPANAASCYAEVVLENVQNGEVLWCDGMQFEQRSYPTSWTLGGTIRSPETLTIPTEGVLHKDEGTIELWINPITVQSWNNFFSMSISTGRFLLYFASAGIVYWDYGPANSGLGTNGGVAVAGQWLHVAMRWSTSKGSRELFVNGQYIGTKSFTPPDSLSSTVSIVNNYGALIDDLRISNIARTDEEIAAAYASGEPLPVDEWTTYKMDMDGILQDIVTTPVCGFVECAGFFQIVAADGLGILTGYEGPAF